MCVPEPVAPRTKHPQANSLLAGAAQKHRGRASEEALHEAWRVTFTQHSLDGGTFEGTLHSCMTVMTTLTGTDRRVPWPLAFIRGTDLSSGSSAPARVPRGCASSSGSSSRTQDETGTRIGMRPKHQMSRTMPASYVTKQACGPDEHERGLLEVALFMHAQPTANQRAIHCRAHATSAPAGFEFDRKTSDARRSRGSAQIPLQAANPHVCRSGALRVGREVARPVESWQPDNHITCLHITLGRQSLSVWIGVVN